MTQNKLLYYKINIKEMNIHNTEMNLDLSKKTKEELLVICEQLGIVKCKSKTKNVLMDLIHNHHHDVIIIASLFFYLTRIFHSLSDSIDGDD